MRLDYLLDAYMRTCGGPYLRSRHEDGIKRSCCYGFACFGPLVKVFNVLATLGWEHSGVSKGREAGLEVKGARARLGTWLDKLLESLRLL